MIVLIKETYYQHSIKGAQIDPIHINAFFAYEDGHFTTEATFKRATPFRDFGEITRALNYAKKDCKTDMVPVTVNLQFEKIEDYEYEQEVRYNALKKLTQEEREILGV